MEAVENALLRALDSSPDGSVANSLAFASSNGLDHKALCGAIRSLAASELVVSKELAEQRWVLTAEAQSYVDQGSSPEVPVFRAVLESMPNGITLTGLRGKVGPVAAGVGFKQAMQHKWVSLLKQDKPKPQQDADAVAQKAEKEEAQGKGGKKKKKEPKAEPLILAQREEVEDACLNLLRRPDLLSAKDAQALKKRKLVAQENTSVAPGLDHKSIVDAFELLVPAFGSSGTLAVAAAVTKGIQSLDRSCGYSGLMLPVCEDAGLAKAFSEGRVGITELLCLSSVCGIGIDTLPVPGNLGCKSISHILADTLALAKRWNKQLSCRLLPCPGKEAGKKTDFRSPYLVDATL